MWWTPSGPRPERVGRALGAARTAARTRSWAPSGPGSRSATRGHSVGAATSTSVLGQVLFPVGSDMFEEGAGPALQEEGRGDGGAGAEDRSEERRVGREG